MNRPWLERYDEGVPPSLEYLSGTLVDVLRATAAERPTHPAVLFKGSTLSYSSLDRLSTAFAATLAAEGVRKGDRVGLLLPNCPQFLIAQFGIWKAGRIVVAVNPIYTERELELPLRETGTEVAGRPDAAVYARESGAAAHHGASRHRDQHQGVPPADCCAAVHPVSREERRATASPSRPATRGSADQLAAGAGKPRSGRQGVGRRPGCDPRKRGHDRNAEGRRRHAPRLCAGGAAAAPVDRGALRALGRPHHAAAAPLPRVRERRRAGHGVHGPQPARPRAEPARHRRCARHDSQGAARILHRGPDPLHRSAQSSRREGGPGRLQLHPGVLLGRVRADGGDAAAVRGSDRRPHHRGLLADRRNDGVRREPGTRHRQDRVSGHAAPRRRRADRRRRTIPHACSRPMPSASSSSVRRS